MPRRQAGGRMKVVLKAVTKILQCLREGSEGSEGEALNPWAFGLRP